MAKTSTSTSKKDTTKSKIIDEREFLTPAAKKLADKFAAENKKKSTKK